VNAATVWTEIFSYIKGSSSSHLYPGWYLSKYAYMNMDSKKSFLARDAKDHIYEIYCQYERWKIREGGYDLMDIVNYLLA